MLKPLDDTFAGVAQSIMNRHWRFAPCDETLVSALSQRHNISEIAARILCARGVGLEQAEDFLTPRLKAALPDPATLQDMDKAANRIADAIINGEQIAIFADYDVDGATSAALWIRYLRCLSGDPWLYVPDRIEEGYGPNAEALLSLAQRGARLVITVDCGVVAHQPLQAAASAGLDVIVVDHHMAEAALPEAVAIINPNRQDDISGLIHLAAVGVCFLTIVGVTRCLRQRDWFMDRPVPDLLQWLDLVALGTVCDVVSLTGLNRAFVTQGLKVMAERRNIGLAALADVARVVERPSAYHLGYILGPRVNAGGRIGKADLGATLLSTDSAGEAVLIAAELEALNAERRRIEAGIIEAAYIMAEQEDAADPVLVVAGDGWHPGVIGIVASRLVERYRKPVCVIGFENGIGKASGRSQTGLDLGNMVIAARQAGILLKGGGHAMAAGFTLTKDRLSDLKQFFRIYAANSAWELAHLIVDGAISVSGATLELAMALDRLGPYGAGHREPTLAMLNCQILKADVVGEHHIRCIIGGSGARLKGIAFRALDLELGKQLLNGIGTNFHLTGRLGIDRWQGREEPKFEITDAVLCNFKN